VKSLKAGSGYLLIDHSDSPGLTPEDVAHVPGAIAVGKGIKHERDVQQCTHCQRQVVLEPLRTRDRGFCPKCNHYICDGCEAIRAKSGACVPFKQVLDRAQTIADVRPLTAEDIPGLYKESNPMVSFTL
jgi:hypothetical protein